MFVDLRIGGKHGVTATTSLYSSTVDASIDILESNQGPPVTNLDPFYWIASSSKPGMSTCVSSLTISSNTHFSFVLVLTSIFLPGLRMPTANPILSFKVDTSTVTSHHSNNKPHAPWCLHHSQSNPLSTPTGEITTSAMLDASVPETVKLSVVARDFGSRPKYGYTTVAVKLMVRNRRDRIGLFYNLIFRLFSLRCRKSARSS